LEQINQVITEDHLDQFEQDGFMLLKNVLNDEQNSILASYVREKHDLGKWNKAQIGKGTSSNVDHAQRGDFIQWLDPENANIALDPYWQLVNLIQISLNRHFYMGLNFFESHMACYPKGSFYKRHSDRHKSGSTRKVSFVYYLNPSWSEEKGGLLNIFNDNETKATVVPFIGHCIVFLSEL
jgi:SM-20-related protein